MSAIFDLSWHLKLFAGQKITLDCSVYLLIVSSGYAVMLVLLCFLVCEMLWFLVCVFLLCCGDSFSAEDFGKKAYKR